MADFCMVMAQELYRQEKRFGFVGAAVIENRRTVLGCPPVGIAI
jgi:hypothetical protein